jgi:VCBS repeat-containing protein
VPEYEVWWRVSEANESQASYSVEQADIFQYQSYSHSDDMFIILSHDLWPGELKTMNITIKGKIQQS